MPIYGPTIEAASGKPSTKVYISFDTGWVGTSPTWVDVTRFVRHDPGIQMSFWRSEEISEAQPNTCSLVLRNDDGRFTPGKTTSPYYPNVKRGRRIKVESTTAAGTSIRFMGYIDDWKPAWFAKVSGINDCAITATSRMARLGRGVELRSIVEETILLDPPSAYYTMGEADGATAAVDTAPGSANPPLIVTGTGAPVVFGSATGPGTDELTAVEFAGGQYLSGAVQTSYALFGTLGCFFLHNGSPSARETLACIRMTNGQHAELVIETNGRLSTYVAGALGAQTTTSVADGLTHHAALYSVGFNHSLYIDGALADSDATALNYDPTQLSIGGGGDLGTSFTGVVAHVALYSLATPTAANIAAVSEAGLGGFAGDTAAARITRYADFLDIDPTELNLDTGQVPDLAHIDTSGQTALDAMRVIEATESGVLFDDRDGRLTFHDRAHRYNAATMFTLSYAGRHIANALEPVLDDQYQRNDVTVTSTDGHVTARATDTTSIASDGWYRDSLTIATTDPDEPAMRAAWVVGRYATPAARISAVEVLLNTMPPPMTALLLAATVGTQFTLESLPANAPASTMTVFVEGAEETITNDEHRITFHTSPAALFDVITLDGGASLGLDSGKPLAL